MAPDAPTLEEIDEALAFATEIPVEDRGDPWHAYVDGLLKQRLERAGTEAQRAERRPIFRAAETR